MIRFRYTLCVMAFSAGIGTLHAQTNARPMQKLYVINTAGDDVTVADVATNKVLGRIEVGPHPHGIAASADGKLLLVTVEGGKGELVWIDPATDKVVRRLRTGSAPNQLAVTPDGKFAYVPVSGGNYEVVDVQEAKIIDKIFTGGQPHNTVCSADGQRMYLAPIGNPKKVTIVDVASRKVLGEIPFSNSVRPVAITNDEKKFFAQVDGLVGIEMADIAARKMIHRVPAEIPAELKKIASRSHGLGIRPGDKEVWDCDVERKVVHVYDITAEKPRQTATIPIGGTVYWLTFGPDGKYCYVSVRSRNEVAVVDTATREVVARIPTGKEPKRLLVVEVGGAGGSAPPDESELAKLAAAMKPGAWAELKTDGYTADLLKVQNHHILEYTGAAAWDPTSQQVLFVGQGHYSALRFIGYSAKPNRWQLRETPSWWKGDPKTGKGPIGHAYYNNTIDPIHGIYYHHQSATRVVHRFDIAKNEWTTLPEIKDAATGHGTAIAYFPERKELVRVLGGTVHVFSEENNTWTRLPDKLAMGPYHNVAQYSAAQKLILVGGGNGSKDLYKLDAEGKITKLPAAPFEVGINTAVVTSDPVSGEFLILHKEDRFYSLNAATATWRDLGVIGMPFQMKGSSFDVVATPLSNHGVTLFFTAERKALKVCLYKHGK